MAQCRTHTDTQLCQRMLQPRTCQTEANANLESSFVTLANSEVFGIRAATTRQLYLQHMLSWAVLRRIELREDRKMKHFITTGLFLLATLLVLPGQVAADDYCCGAFYPPPVYYSAPVYYAPPVYYPPQVTYYAPAPYYGSYYGYYRPYSAFYPRRHVYTGRYRTVYRRW